MRNTERFGNLQEPFTQTVYVQCIGYQTGVGILTSVYYVEDKKIIVAQEFGHRPVSISEVFKKYIDC